MNRAGVDKLFRQEIFIKLEVIGSGDMVQGRMGPERLSSLCRQPVTSTELATVFPDFMIEKIFI